MRARTALLVVGAIFVAGGVGVVAGTDTGTTETTDSATNTAVQTCTSEITFRIEDTEGNLVTDALTGVELTNVDTRDSLGGAEAEGGTRTVEIEYQQGDTYRATAVVAGDRPTSTEFDPCERSTVTMTVNLDEVEALKLPTAGFEISPSNPTVGEEITVRSTATDRDDDIETYEWRFDDGTTATGQEVTHTYSEPGKYIIFHQVVDAGGRADSASKRISVASETACSKTVDIRFVDENGELVEDAGQWQFNLGGRVTERQRVLSATASETFDFAPGENTLVADFDREYRKTFEGCPPDTISISINPDALRPDDLEPNDDRDSAAPYDVDRSDLLTIIDGEDDWFAFNTNPGNTDLSRLDVLGVLVGFDHDDGNIEAELYGPDGELLDSSYTETDGESLKLREPTDQPYYLRVYATDGATLEYRLTGDGRENFDIPNADVFGRYGSPLPERQNDFPVMPVLAPDRTQELRLELAAWLVGSGTPERRTVRVEGAVEGNPTVDLSVVENTNRTLFRGSYGQVVLGNVSITPTETGDDVIRLVYEDGTPLKRVNSASSGDDLRANLTLDVAEDPPNVAVDVLSTEDGTVRAQVVRGDTSDPLNFARASLVDNGTVIQTATADVEGVASLSLPSDAGTNLSVVSVPPGFERGTAQLDIDPADIPGDSGSESDDEPSAGDSESTDDGQSSSDGSSSDGSGPGFGLGAGLTGLTTLGYLLRRRGSEPA